MPVWVAAILTGGVSFALLCHEVVLLRLLAMHQWTHLAYLVLGVAFLGFGAAGSLDHRFRSYWNSHATAAIAWMMAFTAMFLAVSRYGLGFLPPDTFLAVWRPSEIKWLLLQILLLFLPFLSGALVQVTLLSMTPERVGVLYGANLLGSGVGALAALLLLEWSSPGDLPYWLALGLALMGLLAVERKRSGPALLAIAVTLSMGWIFPADPLSSQYKDLSRTLLMPEVEVVSELSGARGVITLLSSPHLRPGGNLSLGYAGDIPPRPVLFHDGNGAGALPAIGDPDVAAMRSHSLGQAAFVMRSAKRVLVLGAGAGELVAMSLEAGAQSVTAVESNPTLLEVLDDVGTGEKLVYNDPRVTLVKSDGRSYVDRPGPRFDLVILPPAHGEGGGAGMRAVYEDYLLTVESMARLWERLEPNGVIMVTVALDYPPRRPLRLGALLAAGLRQQGVSDPASHMAVLRSWSAVTLLVSKPVIAPIEKKKLKAFAMGNGFDAIALTDAEEAASEKNAQVSFHKPADRELDEGLQAILEGQEAKSPFRIAPPTDDRPYFLHFLTWDGVEVLRQQYGERGLMLTEWGYLLVWATLVGLLVLGGILIILPLWLWAEENPPDVDRKGVRRLIYFAAIGLGFMLVEMYLIQKLVRVLGDPTFAVAVALAGLLMFGGAGSFLIGAAPVAARRWVPVGVTLLAGSLLLFHQGFATLANGLAQFESDWLRITLSLAAIAPIALLMGTFFPSGIRLLEEEGLDNWLPWAWGVNGLLSVAGGPFGTLLALDGGLASVAMAGAACYGVVAATLLTGKS